MAIGTQRAFMWIARNTRETKYGKREVKVCQLRKVMRGETMKAILTNTSFLTLTLAAVGLASAQSYAVPSGGFGGYGTGYGDFGYGYHASTYEEGVLRGYATLYQGIGQANYYNSLARINNEEAFSRYVENRQKATDAYFYMRQANRSARAAERSPRLTQEQYVALAKKEAPLRLSEQQYDRTFGRLNWPAALSGEQFAAERTALDQAFRARSPGDAGASTEFYGDVQKLTATLETKLRTQIGELDSAQYMTAKKFLLGLSYESRQPLVGRALAAK